MGTGEQAICLVVADLRSDLVADIEHARHGDSSVRQGGGAGAPGRLYQRTVVARVTGELDSDGICRKSDCDVWTSGRNLSMLCPSSQGSSCDGDHTDTWFDHGIRAQIGHKASVYLIFTVGNGLLSCEYPKTFGARLGGS
ncbi:hypothetical protein GCM10010193_17020 [Kitasatospora atroaurantiaca]